MAMGKIMVNREATTRAGFIALMGAPNAGKSTLVNYLVGSQVSLVTRKAQTTRTRIRGIRCFQDCQYILVDTPGLFAPRDQFDASMLNMAMTSAQQADMVWLIIDAAVHHAVLKADKMLAQLFANPALAKKPFALLLNKIDNMKKNKLLPLTAELQLILSEKSTRKDHQIFMISALSGNGCEQLLETARQFMPQSVFLYPEDQIADMPLQLMAAEITRGHIFERMHQEVPYEIAVETMSWLKQKNGSIRIEQNIYISRLALKPMLIGKKGETIKVISQSSRLEIEELTGVKVHLFVFVKHQENWRSLKQFRLMQGME